MTFEEVVFYVEEIKKELSHRPKIKLSECGVLLQTVVASCLVSESGMYFLEREYFLEQVMSGKWTKEMWEELEGDVAKYESLISGAIDFHTTFELGLEDYELDCILTCYMSLPYYFI